jgi:hypothetical protein
MIRHLILESGYELTECRLTSALPGTLTNFLEHVTCRDCKTALVRSGRCSACGGGPLEWHHAPMSGSGVPDGRLRAGDVVSGFYLGCGTCSETLISRVHPDEVAAALNASGWRP